MYICGIKNCKKHTTHDKHINHIQGSVAQGRQHHHTRVRHPRSQISVCAVGRKVRRYIPAHQTRYLQPGQDRRPRRHLIKICSGCQQGVRRGRKGGYCRFREGRQGEGCRPFHRYPRRRGHHPARRKRCHRPQSHALATLHRQLRYGHRGCGASAGIRKGGCRRHHQSLHHQSYHHQDHYHHHREGEERN